jgi:hypothetical protein
MTTYKEKSISRRGAKLARADDRSKVYRGEKKTTLTGLKRSDLTRSKSGKIVSKKQHDLGKKLQPYLTAWNKHVADYRESHPSKSLREALKAASKTYRGAPAAKKAMRDPFFLYDSAPKWYAPCAKYKTESKCPPKYLTGLCGWTEKRGCRALPKKKDVAWAKQKASYTRTHARKGAPRASTTVAGSTTVASTQKHLDGILGGLSVQQFRALNNPVD